MRTDIVIPINVGNTFTKPIMGGVTLAKVKRVDFRWTGRDIYNIRVGYEYYDGPTRRTEEHEFEYHDEIETAIKINFEHKFTIGDEVLILVNYIGGSEIVRTKITLINFDIGDNGSIKVNYNTRDGSSVPEREVYTSPEECLTFLTRKLK